MLWTSTDAAYHASAHCLWLTVDWNVKQPLIELQTRPNVAPAQWSGIGDFLLNLVVASTSRSQCSELITLVSPRCNPSVASWPHVYPTSAPHLCGHRKFTLNVWDGTAQVMESTQAPELPSCCEGTKSNSTFFFLLGFEWPLKWQWFHFAWQKNRQFCLLKPCCLPAKILVNIQGLSHEAMLVL